MSETQPYRESEDHVPDPTAMTGTLETSGVGGGHHSRLESIVGVFKEMLHHTVERHGATERSGPIVLGDTTGVPAPSGSEAAVSPEESESEPESPQEAEESESSEPESSETPADGDSGSKTPAGRRVAKKAAVSPDTTKK